MSFKTMNANNHDQCSSDDDDDKSWDDCEVPEDVNVCCLFCDMIFKSCDDLFAHCATDVHDHFDIAKLKQQMSLDCFSYIRLINYIRKENPAAANLQGVDLLRRIIADDAYLMPVVKDDPLLMFDIEDLPVPVSGISVHSEPLVTEESHLEKRLRDAEDRLKDTEHQLVLAMEQIDRMKSSAFQGLMKDGEVEGSASAMNDAKQVQASRSEGYNYYSSYSHYGIHLEMLQDEARTLSYRDAILKNSHLFEGNTVLDVGCGTAIMSMFAAQSGALRVFGVDQSEIIYRAMDIVRENHVEDRVTLLKGRMEEVRLEEQVDILVSEWMGYFLLFECMLDTVINARDNHLKPGGLMLPNRTTVNIAGVCDLDAHSKLVSYWDDVYGYKMSCLKREVVEEANVELISSDKLITEPCLVRDLNLMVCTTDDVQFTASFQLRVTLEGLLTAFVGWFDAFFDLPNAVSLSTSPSSSPTHWKQTVFYLLKPLPLKKGDLIEGTISCKRLPTDQRGLKVQIDFGDNHCMYLMQ